MRSSSTPNSSCTVCLVRTPLSRTCSYVWWSSKITSKVIRSVPAFLLRTVLANSPRVVFELVTSFLLLEQKIGWLTRHVNKVQVKQRHRVIDGNGVVHRPLIRRRGR